MINVCHRVIIGRAPISTRTVLFELSWRERGLGTFAVSDVTSELESFELWCYI